MAAVPFDPKSSSDAPSSTRSRLHEISPLAGSPYAAASPSASPHVGRFSAQGRPGNGSALRSSSRVIDVVPWSDTHAVRSPKRVHGADESLPESTAEVDVAPSWPWLRPRDKETDRRWQLARQRAGRARASGWMVMLCVMGLPAVFFSPHVATDRKANIAMWAVTHLVVAAALVADMRWSFCCCSRGRLAGRSGWVWSLGLSLWAIGNLLFYHRANVGEMLGCTPELAGVSFGVLVTPWFLTIVMRLPFAWARALDAVMMGLFLLDSYAEFNLPEGAESCLSSPVAFVMLYVTNMVVVTIVERNDVITFLKLVRLEQRAGNAVASRDAFLRYMFHEVRVPLNAVTVGLEVLEEDVQELEQQWRDVSAARAGDASNGGGAELRASEAAAAAGASAGRSVSHGSVTNGGNDGGVAAATLALLRSVDRQRDTVKALKDQALSAVRILSTTLTLESLEKQQTVLVPTAFRVADLVESLVASFAHVAEGKGVVLEAVVSTELPECAMGDQTRLQQVLANLISNALKFCDAGARVVVRAGRAAPPLSPTVHLPAAVAAAANALHVGSRRSLEKGGGGGGGGDDDDAGVGRYLPPRRVDSGSDSVLLSQESRSSWTGPVYPVAFAVEDTGCGMSSEEMGRLFRPYSQFRRGLQMQGGGGTGLGLSLARALVELHGGEIVVDSEPERGSRFSLVVLLPELPPTLMRAQSSVDDADVKPTWSESGASGATSRVKRVLVVDDSSTGRRMMLRMLPKVALSGGMTIESVGAEDGLEAVQLVEDGQEFDLIIMDISMPRMDGIEATKRIRALLPEHEAPIVGLSGNTLPQDVQELRSAGAIGFLPKPLTREMLRAELKRLGWRVA